ncbi:MAG: hypothetical protein CL911_05740 [Deltaproteobacteria bacterium]|nr:hypothetical protein [Deltaproteobacteria bacterium]
MTLKLYHCKRARSVRPLWTLEEMGLDYELITMPFPPRYLAKEFKQINPLGTVPALVNGNLVMTESAGICQYLVDKYGPTNLAVGKDEADYGNYLNWLHRSDATLTFPQTLVLRYTRLEPEAQRNPQVANDYRKWFLYRGFELIFWYGTMGKSHTDSLRTTELFSCYKELHRMVRTEFWNTYD